MSKEVQVVTDSGSSMFNDNPLVAQGRVEVLPLQINLPEEGGTREETDANFRMSFEGLSYMILQVVGVSDNQLIQLLAPFNGTFPNTRPQFQQMIGAIRRMGHILENQPGNIAQSLRNRSDIVQRSFVNFGR